MKKLAALLILCGASCWAQSSGNTVSTVTTNSDSSLPGYSATTGVGSPCTNYNAQYKNNLNGHVIACVNTNPISVTNVGTWQIINSGSGGAATWGSVAGLIGDQSDLQTALAAKQNTLSSPTTISGLWPAGSGALCRDNTTGNCGISGGATYTAGSGLSLASNAFSLAPPTTTILGGTKSLTCAVGSHLSGIDTTGTPTCSADAGGATYSAGSGLSLASNTFSLAAPSATVLGGTKSLTCSAGSHLSGIDTTGTPSCTADAGGTTYTAGTGLSLSGNVFSVPYGTTSGTAAQGNDSRITGAFPSASFTAANVTGLFTGTGTYLKSDGTRGTPGGGSTIASTTVLLKGDNSGNGVAATSGDITTLLGTLPVANGGTGQTTLQASINALAGTQSAGKYLRSDGTNTILATIQAADVPTLNQNTTGSAATATSATTATNIAGGALGSVSYQSAAGTTALLAGNAAATDQVLVSHGTGSVSAAPTFNNAPALSAANMTSFPTLNQNTTGNAATATTASVATAANNLSSGALGSLPYQSASGTTALLAGNTTATKKFMTQTGTGSVSAAPVWGTIAAGDVSGLATSATTDTTNAANITSGTLGGGRLPAPTASVLGGTKSLTCSAGQHLSSIDTTGTPVCSADTGGTTYSAGNGLSLSSNTFSLAAPTTSVLGGTKSLTCSAGQHISSIDTTGTPVCSADSGGAATIPSGTVANANANAGSTLGSLYYASDASSTQLPYYVRSTVGSSPTPLLTTGPSGVLTITGGNTIDITSGIATSASATIGTCSFTFGTGLLSAFTNTNSGNPCLGGSTDSNGNLTITGTSSSSTQLNIYNSNAANDLTHTHNYRWASDNQGGLFLTDETAGAGVAYFVPSDRTLIAFGAIQIGSTPASSSTCDGNTRGKIRNVRNDTTGDSVQMCVNQASSAGYGWIHLYN